MRKVTKEVVENFGRDRASATGNFALKIFEIALK